MNAILMICLGNICRSPVAEGILQYKANENKLNIHIDSAATSNYNLGQNPDKRAIAHAKKNGIDISKLVSRQFSVTDFDRFDIIYVMDNNNYNDIVNLARNETDRNKVRMILNEVSPGKNIPVPDPYFGTAQDFDNVYRLLDIACDVIITNIKKSMLTHER